MNALYVGIGLLAFQNVLIWFLVINLHTRLDRIMAILVKTQ